MRRRFTLALGAFLGATVLAAGASAAGSGPAITGTAVSTFSESFSDEAFLCEDELCTVTADGRAAMHFTFFEETGAFHFTEVVRAQVVAVPLDGTGVSYTGTFRERLGEHQGRHPRRQRRAERPARDVQDEVRMFLQEHRRPVGSVRLDCA